MRATRSTLYIPDSALLNSLFGRVRRIRPTSGRYSNAGAALYSLWSLCSSAGLFVNKNCIANCRRSVIEDDRFAAGGTASPWPRSAWERGAFLRPTARSLKRCFPTIPRYARTHFVIYRSYLLFRTEHESQFINVERFSFADVTPDGLGGCATSASVILDARTALVRRSGSVFATKAGEVFSAIRIWTSALTTDRVRTTARATTPDRGRTLVRVPKASRAPIVNKELTDALNTLVSTEVPAMKATARIVAVAPTDGMDLTASCRREPAPIILADTEGLAENGPEDTRAPARLNSRALTVNETSTTVLRRRASTTASARRRPGVATSVHVNLDTLVIIVKRTKTIAATRRVWMVVLV